MGIGPLWSRCALSRARGVVVRVQVLDAWGKDVDIIVATDGSRVLGLGDLGANGMGISIGKLSLYSALGGFDPDRTLPILLDAGTDNAALSGADSYGGLRRGRIPDDEYYPFVDEFVTAVHQKWPRAVLQFEDIASPRCFALLQQHRHKLAAFNDDIQVACRADGSGGMMRGFACSRTVGFCDVGERKKGLNSGAKRAANFAREYPPPPCACTALSKHGVGVEPPF